MCCPRCYIHLRWHFIIIIIIIIIISILLQDSVTPCSCGKPSRCRCFSSLHRPGYNNHHYLGNNNFHQISPFPTKSKLSINISPWCKFYNSAKCDRRLMMGQIIIILILIILIVVILVIKVIMTGWRWKKGPPWPNGSSGGRAVQPQKVLESKYNCKNHQNHNNKKLIQTNSNKQIW